MADNNGVAVPLAEQLRSVPWNAVLRIDTPNALGCMDTRSIPVGRLCHEAAYAMARGVAMQEHTVRHVRDRMGDSNNPEIHRVCIEGGNPGKWEERRIGRPMQEHTGRGEAAVLVLLIEHDGDDSPAVALARNRSELLEQVKVAVWGEPHPADTTNDAGDDMAEGMTDTLLETGVMTFEGDPPLRLVRIPVEGWFAATVAAPAEGQPSGNRCGCNHWLKPICPERHCSWQGKRPVDAVPAEGQPTPPLLIAMQAIDAALSGPHLRLDAHGEIITPGGFRITHAAQGQRLPTAQEDRVLRNAARGKLVAPGKLVPAEGQPGTAGGKEGGRG